MDANTTAPAAPAIDRIAAAITAGATTQSEIREATGLGRATVSVQVKKLVAAGRVIATTHDDKTITYADPAAVVAEAEAVAAAAVAVEEAPAEVAPVAEVVEVPAAPVTAPSCPCGNDEVGHVHPDKAPARRTGARKVSKDAAWTAAEAALTAAGAEGLAVPALWDVLMGAGLALTGAYNLVNAHRTAGDLVTVTDHREVRSRTYALATAVKA